MNSNVNSIARLMNRVVTHGGPATFAVVAASALASPSFGASSDHDGCSHSHAAGVWWHNGFTCQHAAGPVWLRDDGARKIGSFDAASGRSLLNYPPHRFVDYKRMSLAITIPDMNTPTLGAAAMYTLEPIAAPVESLTLDVSPAMTIQRVSLGSDPASATPVTYTHDGERLSLTFSPPLALGTSVDLTIVYQLNNPQEGITWTPESPAWPGRPAQLHSQGQPESNHYWFPCLDFPNERLMTEMLVTVPDGFQVISNGRLVTSKAATIEQSIPVSGADGASGGTATRTIPARTFHWLQDKPHVNYLVSLIVGKFDVVDVASGGSVPMPVFAPLGRGSDVKRTYGRTPDMVTYFSKLIDEPYPWDKYSQTMVWNFGAGGMENTSATTMFDTAIFDQRALLDGDLDGLISHELAHQWFGDLMTCNSWEHIWLNEGFATYFTHLWFEERDGRDAYLSGLWGTYRGLAANDKADAPFQPAMCSKEYVDPWECFRRAANPYPKGASVLHMLRSKLGDQVFFDGLKLYVDRHKFKTVETDDLRYALEETSGLSLDRFFRQWCYKPGVPSADVTLTWDSSSSSLNATLTQTQPIDGANPAFFYSLPIWVRLPAGETRTLTLDVDGKTASASFQLPAEPTLVAVDPELNVLGAFNVTTPSGYTNWRDLLAQGPTIAAKLSAVTAIRAMGAAGVTSDAALALNAAARNGKEHFSLQTAAVEALGEVATPDLLASLALNPPKDARVRKVVIEQLPGTYDKLKGQDAATASRLLEKLRAAAKDDDSYAVRSSALRGLARLGGPEAKPVIIEALKAESQNDQVRQAALEALGMLDDPEGLTQAIRFTESSAYPRTRPVATGVVTTLAKHNPDLAFNTLKDLLNDPNDRTARAAGDGLVRLKDPRGIAVLEAFIANAPTPAAKNFAARWLEELRTAAAK